MNFQAKREELASRGVPKWKQELVSSRATERDDNTGWPRPGCIHVLPAAATRFPVDNCTSYATHWLRHAEAVVGVVLAAAASG